MSETCADARMMEILIVEDNPGDVRLIKEALAETRLRKQLHVAEDGVEAMAFLRQEGVHRNAPEPDLVLLDLNLPRHGGLDVLAEVKADSRLKHIPVVVLSSSGAEADVIRAYDLHANCYVVKPIAFSGLLMTVQSIEKFWLEFVAPPRARTRRVPS
jgi:chemotaxis family two-component system response regulator Rcp1